MAECALFHISIQVNIFDLNFIHIPALMNDLTCKTNKHVSINVKLSHKIH